MVARTGRIVTRIPSGTTGGSFAGLSAALYVARARRRVCVIDQSAPRNRFTNTSHGFLTRDGDDPRAMHFEARTQLQQYPTVRFIDAKATTVTGKNGDFLVTLDTGVALTSLKLVLAFGVDDILPDLPGVRERWGKSVLACPYCHGYEFADRQLGVLYAGPMSTLHAMLITDWGPVTLYLNGHDMPDETTVARLSDRDVRIESAPVVALRGEGTSLSSIVLYHGRQIPIDALYIAPPSRLNSTIAEQLGCVIEDGRYGPVIATDSAKMTTIEGVYAAGDIARANNALIAAADGASAGIALHASLVFGTIPEMR
jgi:thioredoxin reductase